MTRKGIQTSVAQVSINKSHIFQGAKLENSHSITHTMKSNCTKKRHKKTDFQYPPNIIHIMMQTSQFNMMPHNITIELH